MSFKLRTHHARTVLAHLLLAVYYSMDCTTAVAQDAVADSIASSTSSRDEEREDGWIIRTDDTGKTRTRHLTLHPKLEPVPALKHRFIPDDFDRIDGNAAIFYLKAMGFLEESHAKEMIMKFERDSAKKAEEEGQDDYPPYVWLKMSPQELPVDEVKKFLRLVGFQKSLLRNASYRTDFSLDRNIKGVDNPIFYLLPEINAMRQVARYQSLRVRLALAEDRIDDAITYLGQNLAMAEHLGQDDFLVSNLVGMAIASIAWNDMLYLLERPDAPNLYWAYAVLPKPLVSTRRALAYERHLLFEQVKLLREVDTQVRNAGYWQDFIDRLIAESDSFAVVLDANWNLTNLDKSDARAVIASAIAAAYPGAKQYLVKEVQMDLEAVNAYAKTQTVFLAMKIYSERARDELLKWQFVPYPLAEASPLYAESFEQMQIDDRRIGWITRPAQALLPAAQAIATAVERSQQRFAMTQTVEAIRFYAAKHNGRLPQNLSNLALPAVHDPITGRPFEYRLKGDRAVLRGAEAAGTRNQLVLQIAK